MNTSDFKYVCGPHAAERVANWLFYRGGLAHWTSLNLGAAGDTMTTPKEDQEGGLTTKPRWDLANEPTSYTYDPARVGVTIDKEVKRFHVGVRVGAQGLSMKVTDGGSRRIQREVEKAGEGAYYCFDYGDYENAVIMAPESVISLLDWIEENMNLEGRKAQ